MTANTSDFSYSGDESYKYVERLVRESRRILIVSPYIDGHYARFLARSSRDKEIYVISSSLEDGPKGILLGSRANAALLALISISIMLGFALLFLEHILLGPAVLLVSILALYFAMADANGSRVRLKTPSKFVHAKMYIGDSSAIQGSANLTFKGMHRNIEHVELTSDQVRVKELEKQFWKIWSSF